MRRGRAPAFQHEGRWEQNSTIVGTDTNGAKLGLRIFAVFGAVTEFLKDMAVSGEELKRFGTTLDRAGFSPAGAEGNQVPANEPEQRKSLVERGVIA